MLHRARPEWNPGRVDPPPLPYACPVTPAQLSRTVLHAVRRAAADGELGAVRGGSELPQRVTVESPPRRGPGDYAVSVAFRLAGPAGMTPYDVARVLRAGLARQDGIRAVQIAGDGYLNITLDERARAELVAELSRPPHAESPPRRPGPDTPAADIAQWSAATCDAPAALAVRTAQASPLFRVQYAHARARALSRNARDLGFRGEPHAVADTGAVSGAGSGAPRTTQAYGPSGEALLALLADHRRVSEQTDPARHARHLVAVGDAFFDFHDQCPPLPSGDEKPGAAHRARLALVEATGTVLAGGLTQLGVSAPAHL
jgi:arginyl-tRNA synthetase